MEKPIEKPMDFVAIPKSYEKELQSDEPFIRAMYEDLEKRIDEFEEDALTGQQKVKLTDFIVVTVIMAIITVVVFSI